MSSILYIHISTPRFFVVLFWLVLKNLGKKKKKKFRASLVAQWLGIRLLMQGTWVRALVREDPTCRGATKPVHHNYWSPCFATREATAISSPRIATKRSPPLATTREKPVRSNEDATQPKIK